MLGLLLHSQAVRLHAQGHWLPGRACANHILRAAQNVDLPNEEGNTPLHWACLNRQAEVVQRLLQAGAKATALNK